MPTLLYGSRRDHFTAVVAADGDDQDEDKSGSVIDDAIDEALDGEMDHEDMEILTKLVSGSIAGMVHRECFTT